MLALLGLCVTGSLCLPLRVSAATAPCQPPSATTCAWLLLLLLLLAPCWWWCDGASGAGGAAELMVGVVVLLALGVLWLTRGACAQGADSKMTIETRIDPSLINGMTIEVGDKYLDLSVSTQLKKLHQLLLGGV